MLVFAFLLFLAAPLQAQSSIRWGARFGITDGEPMIGADLIMPLGSGFQFNPNIEISSEVVSTNADVHYDFQLNRMSALWAGAGVALINPDSHDLDVGVNLLFGIGTRRGGNILYSQAKITAPTDYDSYTSIALGIRF